jgi:hypothetical protein
MMGGETEQENGYWKYGHLFYFTNVASLGL